MFSGLVYCADCKAKVRYCTTKYFEARQDHFVYANYRSNTGSCSAHFIRAVVLEQMVWEYLKEVIWYVGHYEGHFRSIMESKLQAESKEVLRVKRKQLEKNVKRIQELDRLFIHLYEDNVASRISDERFNMMSQAYEDEQRNLKAEAEVLRQEIETLEQQNQNLEQFIQKVRKYAELTELTPYAPRPHQSGGFLRELKNKTAVKGKKRPLTADLFYIIMTVMKRSDSHDRQKSRDQGIECTV